MSLILVGNIPVDLVLRVASLPDAGDDVTAESCALRPGGGFHVLAAAAEAGLSGCYAGTHGTGANGDLVRAQLLRIGATVLQRPSTDHDTGLVVVLVDAAGERTFVTSPDAVRPYTSGMLARIHLAPADIVYVSGYSLGLGPASDPLAGWLGGLRSDHLVCCDLGPPGASAGPDILRTVLARVDWLACNEREASRLTGDDDAGAACGALRRRTDHAGVLVRAGRRGCWLAAPGLDPVLVAAPPAGRAADTNGAGDTHSGRFLAALAQGRSPRDAVRLANAAASRLVVRGTEGR